MLTDEYIKLIETDFDRIFRMDWPVEIRMYANLYGDLVHAVPHYMNRLSEQASLDYGKIFDDTPLFNLTGEKHG